MLQLLCHNSLRTKGNMELAEMSTAEAARELGVTRQHVDALLTSGALTGRTIDGRRWLVDASSVRAYDAIRTTPGARWSPTAAWAVLDTLDGAALPADPKLRHRTATRIRTLDARTLGRKVATRVTTHRFVAEDRDAVAADLALTGGSAHAEHITGLTGARTITEGYLRGQDLEAFIVRHLLIPDANGNVIVYNGAGDRYATTEPGPAVIAADLIRSTNTRERSAGLTLLEGLRTAWLASHTT